MIHNCHFSSRKTQRQSSPPHHCSICKNAASFPSENELLINELLIHSRVDHTAAIRGPFKGRAHGDFVMNLVQANQDLDQTRKPRSSLASDSAVNPLSHMFRFKANSPVNNNSMLEKPHEKTQKTVLPRGRSCQRVVTEVAWSHLYLEPGPDLLLQPTIRPISHERLLAKVKEIYARLCHVEDECKEADKKRFLIASETGSSNHIKLTTRQWQALVFLHTNLLHEHHDFFIVSQYPSARPALRKLAEKYSMLARMWSHGICTFLEVLRYGLPNSYDHLVNMSFSMLTLLYETLPTFKNTWIEFLGDLGRYRAVVEDDINFRDMWSEAAEFWCAKAIGNCPIIGQHKNSLAILSQPCSLQQLGFYAVSLTSIIPFEEARDGIKILFYSILDRKGLIRHSPVSMETAFMMAHAFLFTEGPPSGWSINEFDIWVHQLLGSVFEKFENHICNVTTEFEQQGVFVALSNIAGLLGYGVMQLKGVSRLSLRFFFEEIEDEKDVAKMETNTNDALTFAHLSPMTWERMTKEEFEISMIFASDLAFGCLAIGLRCIEGKHVYPMIHVYLAFLFSIINIENAVRVYNINIPWEDISSFLNSLPRPDPKTSKVFNEDFPRPDKGIGRPLPEDFMMRGLVWSESYFPDKWFSDAAIDDDERTLELPGMAQPRVERLLWLGNRVASSGQRLLYDENSRSFFVREGSCQKIE